ncbi:hypothetical protein Phum_PHUM579920 [Pediculus humanus corporis]|uniref:Ribosomal protein eL8/eL30/eS12/Gadd45 domain-containing protein n=1 Tax=Pediculus humanus subsp. corporis TaxID=121224 RepID=E0W1U9_PEDHC|nr:uncharacterized protein Phum_PHUM579920 [Pediculus humanus corporis]EEB19543.1 hypothetical protein Phum_PHUM579920 [Pediculus humanus corporis]
MCYRLQNKKHRCLRRKKRKKPTLISKSDENEICLILERLLPEAKILFQTDDNNEKNDDNKSNESLKESKETNNVKEEAKEKRKGLALGVNDLNRCIKKNLISAALLASDVSPKLLIHHLNLLCIHNKIPYLHLERLRKVTYKTLGFSCIALGFKKNYETFSEIISKIQSLAVINDNISNDKEFNKSLSKIKRINLLEKPEKIEEECNFEFDYLYRSSISERIFSPETYFQKNEMKNNEKDFISIQNNQNDGTKKNKI